MTETFGSIKRQYSWLGRRVRRLWLFARLVWRPADDLIPHLPWKTAWKVAKIIWE